MEEVRIIHRILVKITDQLLSKTILKFIIPKDKADLQREINQQIGINLKY